MLPPPMNLWWYRTFPRLTFHARKLVGASYEREMQLLEALCDPQKTGIDVGAKVGMYTFRIRDRSSDVIAFEPIPVFQNYLRAVFDGKRGRIEPYALSSEKGSAVLRLPFDGGGGPQFGRSTIEASNQLQVKEVARTEELQIETRRLDDYELPSLGFIKIDVEGHELSVLAGAEKTIAKHRPNLLIECNDDHQPGGVKKLAEWFAAHEYDAYFMFVRDILPMSAYNRSAHWDTNGVENFIGIHRSHPEVLDRLKAVAAKTSLKQRAV